MTVYNSILLATDAADSHEEKCQVYDTAIEWADMEAANLKILHTLPPIGKSGVEFQLPTFSDIEAGMKQEAQKEMSKIADEMGINDSKPNIIVGYFDEVVLNQKDVDLIVVNNDNEHYWGSKIEAILQGDCDLLAVKS